MTNRRPTGVQVHPEMSIVEEQLPEALVPLDHRDVRGSLRA